MRVEHVFGSDFTQEPPPYDTIYEGCFGNRRTTSSSKGAWPGIFSDYLLRRLDPREPAFSAWTKPSAVMVIIAEQPESSVLLIHRLDTLTYHAGQIACPGGSYDPRLDHSLWDTAVRETREEVGIVMLRQFFCGFLDPVHIVVTGFTIAPAVVVLPNAPVVIPDRGEVASYQWVTLAELRQVRRMSRVLLAGASYRLPEFPLRWGRLWGATARIIDQLLSVLDDLPGGDRAGGQEVNGGNPQAFSH